MEEEVVAALCVFVEKETKKTMEDVFVKSGGLKLIPSDDWSRVTVQKKGSKTSSSSEKPLIPIGMLSSATEFVWGPVPWGKMLRKHLLQDLGKDVYKLFKRSALQKKQVKGPVVHALPFLVAAYIYPKMNLVQFSNDEERATIFALADLGLKASTPFDRDNFKSKLRDFSSTLRVLMARRVKQK